MKFFFQVAVCLFVFAPFVTCKADSGSSDELFECVRKYEEELPFIGDSPDSIDFSPHQLSDKSWRGIEVHHGDTPSPHLVGTHVESSRHVFGDAIEIAQVIANNPVFQKIMSGLHVKVSPESLMVDEIIELSSDNRRLIFENGETYELSTVTPFAQERVITREKLEAELLQFEDKHTDVLLIQMIGEGEKIKDWAYLTNEAVELAVKRGFRLIVLNVPSMDRESDGARTSNHKLIFRDSSRLIVESAQLNGAPLGLVEVDLKLKDLGVFMDCCACQSLLVRGLGLY